MSRLKVPMPRRPKLSKDGLLTFMSPSGYGLAALAGACRTPSCACRDILLTLFPIDFRVKSVAFAKGKLSFESEQLSALDREASISARIILETGELLLEPERTQHPEAEALLAPLRDALDGELLDDFSRLWRRLKGQPAVSDEFRRDADLGDWDRGNALAFGAVFEELRVDSYAHGGRVYETDELYCPSPECDCWDVTIAFIDPAGDSEDVGAATIDLEMGEVSFEHRTDDQGLVPGLWKRFVHRHRGVSRLHERRERMKEFGEGLFKRMDSARQALKVRPAFDQASSNVLPASVQAPRSALKIGRNERCPCGSGKKYKKCCLLRASP